MTTLVYILGASHSGTTLLAMSLGAHPDACTVGQLGAEGIPDPDRYRCSCGEPLSACPFWQEVTKAMDRRGISFDVARPQTSINAAPGAYLPWLLNPLCRGPFLESMRDLAVSLSPEWRGHLARTQQRYAAFAQTVATVTGARVVVDSSKTGVRLKYLLRNRDLDVRVIWMLRDGRAVSLTYVDPLNFADARAASFRAGGFGGNRDAEQKTMPEAAREWRRSNEEAEAVLERVSPERWIRVQYEELCRSPRKTLQTLCEFTGLAFDRLPTDFRSVPQHVIGNGMRLDRDSSVQLDERWRERLSPDDLLAFDAVAGNLNRRYGYK